MKVFFVLCILCVFILWYAIVFYGRKSKAGKNIFARIIIFLIFSSSILMVFIFLLPNSEYSNLGLVCFIACLGVSELIHKLYFNYIPVGFVVERQTSLVPMFYGYGKYVNRFGKYKDWYEISTDPVVFQFDASPDPLAVGLRVSVWFKRKTHNAFFRSHLKTAKSRTMLSYNTEEIKGIFVEEVWPGHTELFGEAYAQCRTVPGKLYESMVKDFEKALEQRYSEPFRIEKMSVRSVFQFRTVLEYSSSYKN